MTFSYRKSTIARTADIMDDETGRPVALVSYNSDPRSPDLARLLEKYLATMQLIEAGKLVTVNRSAFPPDERKLSHVELRPFPLDA